ncbi:hypothetical protein [Nostoc sp.]
MSAIEGYGSFLSGVFPNRHYLIQLSLISNPKLLFKELLRELCRRPVLE